MAAARVLIVEDDQAMAVALRDGFSYEGFDVDVAADGEEGYRLARESHPDLMILDIMLPKMTGLEICKSLRGEGSNLPIIMLTARGQEIDKVLGLKLGADDYVTKPFSFMELRARVDAVLRRSSPTGTSRNGGIHEFGNFMVDLDHHVARKDGTEINLTPREFRLLDHFIHHIGEVVTREQLLDHVWGYDTIPFTRTVDTHIAKLRKKIEDNPSDPHLIVTVHRLGYKFVG
ncbi:MAG: response regulator transcription factor [Thermoanaerobaculales bacterium]|jgi:DNA-binding response OmpR family regulator|nr:response regulator transcription factor [Thermoanaerobaculales bacterium]